MKNTTPIDKFFFEQPQVVEYLKKTFSLKEMWGLYTIGCNILNEIIMVLKSKSFDGLEDEEGNPIFQEQVEIDYHKIMYNLKQLTIAIKETEHIEIFTFQNREIVIHQN